MIRAGGETFRGRGSNGPLKNTKITRRVGTAHQKPLGVLLWGFGGQCPPYFFNGPLTALRNV